VDVAFEIAGVQATLDYALAAVRKGGTIVTVSVWEQVPVVNLTWVMGKEVSVIGSCGYTEYPEVLQAIADGRIPDPVRMVTRRVGLDDAVDRGFEALAQHRAQQVKVLVKP
jgi:threonine dehydrogenase-like Zn-dependent dehydrogenase